MEVLPYSVALADMDLLRLEEDLEALRKSGVCELHVDIADGVVAPSFGMGEAILGQLRSATRLPVHVHLAVEHPERHVQRLIEAGAQHITVHAEVCVHVHRILNLIQSLGASPGIALNPATPLTRLEYVLSMVDRVLILAADHNATEQQAMPIAYERVRILKENLHYIKSKAVLEVQGGLSIDAVARFQSLGADRLVLDRSNVFRMAQQADAPRTPVAESIQKFHQAVETAKHLV